METAVVTGAGRGLGHEIAARLARGGLAVLVTDIDLELARHSAAEIGHGAEAVRLDVRDPSALRAVAAKAAGRGRLAAWVNNAGVLRTGHVWEHTDEAIELLVATNLLGVVQGSRAAIEAMRDGGRDGAGGGRILNVASLSSLTPSPGLAVYGATKQGVLGFSLALQAELRVAGIPIEVRSICPDAVETDMVRERAADPEAAVIWSGGRLLPAGEVADRAVRVLYGDRLVATVPAWRGAVARAISLAPRAGIRTLPAMRRFGERSRARWRDASS